MRFDEWYAVEETSGDMVGNILNDWCIERDRLRKALEEICDYQPSHCRSDYECRASAIIEFCKDTVEQVL